MEPYSWRVPFYAAGDIQIVAGKDIGSLGAASGQAVTVEYSTGNWLRSSFLWIVLFLLLLRKANRTLRGWLIWVPVLVSYVLICFLEKGMLAPSVVFYQVQYMAASFCELLRLFAISLGILLAIADLLVNVKGRYIRFVPILLILFACGAAQARLDGWPAFDTRVWTISYFGLLVFFFVFHRVLIRVSARISRRDALVWYPAVCLAAGVLPVISIAAVMAGGNTNLTADPARFMWLLGPAACVTSLILGLFAAASLKNPVYRQRFIYCFAEPDWSAANQN